MIDSTFFEHHPIFSQLASPEIDWILEHSYVAQYPSGQAIFKEGDQSSHFAVILSGEVAILKNGNDLEERLLRVLKREDFIGEMSIFYPENTRTATARAVSTVELLEIPLPEMQNFLKLHNGLAHALMQKAIVNYLQSENAAIQDLTEKNKQLAQSMQELKAAQEQLIQKETMEHELQMARQVQESFLPHRLPVLPGWDLAVYWNPAREVGGDFYDFTSLDDGRMVLVIGDVTGKGMPAALVMAITRSILRATIRQGGSPGSWLTQMNNLLCEEMPKNMFVTAFIAVVDLQGGKVQFANAGHCLPVHSTKGGAKELKARGMPLGLIPDLTYEEKSISVQSGEWILFLSDGLLEAHNHERKMFGTERLIRIMQQASPSVRAADRIQILVQEQLRFTQPISEQEDDTTLLVLSRD